MRLKKWNGNPILSPNPANEWEKMAVLNPGAIYDGEKVSLLYRASGELVDYRIYVGLAQSQDGFHFTRVGNQPVLGPSEDGFDAGCIEDARVVKIDDTYFMTYAARAHPPCAHWSGRKRQNLPAQTPTWTENITRSGIASSKDLRNWTRLGPCTSEYLDNRDVILFPERIGGKYVMIHRAIDRSGKNAFPQYQTAAIWLTFSDDMKTWIGDVAIAKGETKWEGDWIGGSAPPIRTSEGWLTLYHAACDMDGKGRTYRVGAMLLDLENPRKIIARGNDYILEPETPYELKGCGAADRVVFPCGNVVIGDTLFVYYGGADTVCCVATANLNELLAWLLQFKR
jgi:predicted GH43/DUF377 family glycosyl hydrolase